MKRERKDKLIKQYMPIVPELTTFQKEWIRKETAHYIFVNRDEEGKHHCHCDRCDKDIELGKTKHKAKVICPSCKKELEIHHDWRAQRKVTYDWIVVPFAIDNNTLMLRYVSAFRGVNGTEISELARLVIKTNAKINYTFECVGDGVWEYTERNYFKEYFMYNYRKICCLPAQPYRPIWKKEMKKIDSLKYLDMTLFPQRGYIHSYLGHMIDHGSLYEKLIKAGLVDLAIKDYESYANYSGQHVEYSTKETALTKCLGINKYQLGLLKRNQSIKVLNYIKKFPNITQELLDELMQSNIQDYVIDTITENKISIKKVLRYFAKTQIDHHEWNHYVGTLKKLNYPLDDSYLFPKDFRKEDCRVTAEYLKLTETDKDKLRNKMIQDISKALYNNDSIREFFAGAEGLQVVIPEEANDLRLEGKMLHCCLGTYVDRVAEGKTLIFFIRRIEDPTAPYIAMEYCHGRIVQCRYDHNVSVTDEKIINFTNKLRDALVRENILAA